MNKIRLDLDRLDVASFPTASTPAGARGTVRANAETDWELYTCGLSCDIHQCRHTMEYDGCSD